MDMRFEELEVVEQLDPGRDAMNILIGIATVFTIAAFLT